MSDYVACLAACEACVLACNACTAAFREQGDAGMLTLAVECRQACELAVVSMDRGRQSTRTVCCVCAQLCERLGTECAAREHATFERYAHACRRAATECRRVHAHAH